MTPQLYRQLARLDTPTICNAIEVAQGKRGFANFTRTTMLCSDETAPAMVGYARTAKIAANEPPAEPVEVIKARRMKYYKYMSESEQPTVVVIEDTDYPHCTGAFWGEINTRVHSAFGLSGVLTNGVMRDLGDIPQGFLVVAGSIGPSHSFVHVTDIDCTVRICGATVSPGELIHADRHGAVVIPQDIVLQLASAIETLLASERIVIDATKKADFSFADFKKAWQEFEKVRT